MDWPHLRIMMALIKKKYGLCKEELNLKLDTTSNSQATLKLNTTSIAGTVNPNSPKPKQLPNWFKRPNEGDESAAKASNSDKDKPKKKPKFM